MYKKIISSQRQWLRGAAALSLSAMLAACGATNTAPNTEIDPVDTAVVAPETDSMSGAANALTVAQVMANPQAYYGQVITVVGETEAVFGSSAFKLDEDATLAAGIDNDLPVLSANQENPAVDTAWANNQVQVTGTLRQYIEADIEREFNWFQPGTEWEAEVEENQPVLIADSITQLEAGALAEGLGALPETDVNLPDGVLTVAMLMENPEAYAGQTVTVQGEVQEAYGNGVLRLDEDALLRGGIDNDLLVIGTNLNEGQIDDTGWIDSVVRVTGTVRTFNRDELEVEFNTTFDNPIFNEWEGEAVLIAESAEVIVEEAAQ